MTAVASTCFTSEAIRSAMSLWNEITARALELYPAADAEQLYSIVSAEFSRRVGL